jgi:hypothetical protein
VRRQSNRFRQHAEKSFYKLKATTCTLAFVGIEILEDRKGVGRAYAQVIEHASSKEFRPFFETYISNNATVITDV